MCSSRVFGANLHSYRLRFGFTQREVAAAVEVRQQTVAAWEASRSTPPPNVICALAEFFNITTDELLLSPSAHLADAKVQMQVPVVSSVIPGQPYYLEKDVLSYECVTGNKKSNLVFVKMPDDSMHPMFFQEDFLLVDAASQVKNQEIGLYYSDKSGILVRRKVLEGGTTVLLPLSSKYSIEFMAQGSKEIAEIGRVVKMRRDC